MEGFVKAYLLVSLFFILSSLTQVSAKIIDVGQLNLEIQKQCSSKNKPQWIAKDNWLNDLNKTEIKKLLGAEAPDVDVEFIDSDNWLKAPKLPQSIDWRNKDGKNWVSPMMNQGGCGSCVAFAAIATLETQINISSFLPSLNMQLSPQHLFACGGGYCSLGWRPEPAAKFLMKQGVVDEACMPYSSGASGEDVRCKETCNDAPKRVFKISDYDKPTQIFKNLNNVKKALLKGPVVTTMTVYEDFLTYSHGVYKHTQGSSMGGHAVSLVGYDDTKGAFILRNSWGEDWGEKGFAYMDYTDKSGIGNSTWSYEIASSEKFIAIEYPRNNDFVSGSSEFSFNSSYAGIDHVLFKIIDKNGKIVNQSVADAKSAKTLVETSMIPDGRYDLIAEAFDSGNKLMASSKPQYFYIVNKAPSLKISYKGYQVDLNKEIRGRVEFEVSTESSSVPMNSLEFHYKDETGKEVVRETNYVLSEMRLGWRTGQLPNGKYEIWMVGKVNTKGVSVNVESEHKIVNLKN